MNLKKLKEKLDYYKIPADWYCLGGEAQYCDCILYDGADWIIFNLERGARKNIQKFKTEEAACERLLEMEMTLLEHKKAQFKKRTGR